jgi:RNA polymerase sigma-70 factor (ECF subfamily)
LSADKGVNLNALDDAGLADLAESGNDKAFEVILQRYRQRMLRICLRMMGDVIEAEEAAQDIFVKVYYHLKDYDRKREFAVWCTAIAVNECRDRLRKRQRVSRTFRELNEADRAPAETGPDDCADSREKLAMVEKALEDLPEKLKEVIVLKAYGEYSYEEIAKILKIRLGTVMSRLFRARKRLTKLMEGRD